MRLLTQRKIDEIVKLHADNVPEASARKLLRVVNRILDVPDRLDMWEWGMKYTKAALKQAKRMKPGEKQLDEEREVPECGTIGCLAGWTLVELMPKRAFANMVKDANIGVDPKKYAWGFPGSTPSRAAELLGLRVEVGYQLFQPGAWPSKYLKLYRRSGSAQSRAEATRDRVIHFIQTGE